MLDQLNNLNWLEFKFNSDLYLFHLIVLSDPFFNCYDNFLSS